MHEGMHAVQLLVQDARRMTPEHFLYFGGLPALACVDAKFSMAPKGTPANVPADAALKQGDALRLALLLGESL